MGPYSGPPAKEQSASSGHTHHTRAIPLKNAADARTRLGEPKQALNETSQFRTEFEVVIIEAVHRTAYWSRPSVVKRARRRGCPQRLLEGRKGLGLPRGPCTSGPPGMSKGRKTYVAKVRATICRRTDVGVLTGACDLPRITLPSTRVTVDQRHGYRSVGRIHGEHAMGCSNQ